MNMEGSLFLLVADTDCTSSEGCSCWFNLDTGWTQLKLLQSKLTHITLNAVFSNESSAESFFSRFFFPLEHENKVLTCCFAVFPLKRDF